MNINIEEFPSKAKECIDDINEIIDWSKISIQEEFSRTTNPRTACFASVADVIDVNRSFIGKLHADIDKDEYKKVNEKIEELKSELWELRKIYTEKDLQPTDDEKEKLFKHLKEIKEMIQTTE